MKAAGLSIDVDSVASHLEGYGFERPEDTGQAYSHAIPRILDLLDEYSARATFFLIAAEAENHPAVVRQIAQRGHEVASHSLTHPVPFTALSDDELRREAGGSREILQRLCGLEVVGFRAPSFGLDDRVLAALSAAGYAYDASAFPSPMLVAMRFAIRRRSHTINGERKRSSGWREALRSPRIHQRRTAHGPIVEVPVSTLPLVRLPYYHTPGFLLPSGVTRAIAGVARLRRANVSYTFHAVDFMEVAADGLDPRIARHPGMDRHLDDKLDLARRALADLGRRGPMVALRELVRREHR